MKINFKKINEKAKLPWKKNDSDTGWDLFSTEELTIEPGEIKSIGIGLQWQPEETKEYYIGGQIRPRSGLAIQKGITVLNSPGSIDHNYKDEIRVILINHGKYPFEIKVGDRIAQIVFEKIYKNTIVSEGFEIDLLSNRGGGFGSTGV